MLKSNLKEMLKDRNMSIRAFARAIDYRFGTVRDLHNGTISRIPVELIERACVELKCAPGDLLTIAPDEPKDEPAEE